MCALMCRETRCGRCDGTVRLSINATRSHDARGMFRKISQKYIFDRFDIYLIYFFSLYRVRSNVCTLIVYARLNYDFARPAFIIIAREVVVTINVVDRVVLMAIVIGIRTLVIESVRVSRNERATHERRLNRTSGKLISCETRLIDRARNCGCTAVQMHLMLHCRRITASLRVAWRVAQSFEVELIERRKNKQNVSRPQQLHRYLSPLNKTIHILN